MPVFPHAPRPLVALLALCLTACGGHPEGPTPPPQTPPSETPAPATAPPAAPNGPPRLVFLSAIDGYVEPCGCTIDLTLGGVDRIAARIQAERAIGPTAVLTVGATLFDPHVPDPQPTAQAVAKAELLSKALARIGVDAALPAHAEMRYGAGALEPMVRLWRMPDVTVNVPGGAGRIVTLGDLKVGVLGVVDPADGPVPAGAPTDPAEAARAAAAALRAQGATVVVGLAALPRKPVRTLAKTVEGVDLWVLGVEPHEEARSQPAGGAYVLESGDRGRNLGRVVLLDATSPGPLTDPAGERARTLASVQSQLRMRQDLFARTQDPALPPAISALETQVAELSGPAPVASGKRLEYELLPIGKEVVPEPEIAHWLADYNTRLKEINLANQAPVPPVPAGESAYAQGKNCISCHEKSQTVWLTTRHAHAWQTLVDANKTFDGECVACHVTGWQRPGGVNLKNLEGMTNVQCEACHGPGGIHVDDGGEDGHTHGAVAEAVCKTCHNQFHSPKFDYVTYLPKILGPGHAAAKSAH